MQRFISAQEVANMALFLASDLARSISGQALGVDGHTESLSNLLI
jgi:enoyl-[acyl-carrier-protein] reductase (NADH)